MLDVSVKLYVSHESGKIIFSSLLQLINILAAVSRLSNEVPVSNSTEVKLPQF